MDVVAHAPHRCTSPLNLQKDRLFPSCPTSVEMSVNSRSRAGPDGRAQQPAGKDAINSALLVYVLFTEEGKICWRPYSKIVLYTFSYKSLKKMCLFCKSRLKHLLSQSWAVLLEVAIQRRLAVTFHRYSPGIRRASPGTAVWQPRFICNNLRGLLDISMQLSLMV